jgi:hypothetical protein
VRRAEVRRREAGVREVLEVAQAARQLSDDFHFVAVLRRVRVDDHAIARREIRHRFQQLAGARHGEPGRERGVQAAARLAVPPLAQRHALVDRRPRLLPQPRRDLLVGVHHALADDGPQAHLVERLEDDVGIVDGFHRERGGGAAEEQLARRHSRGRAERRGCVRRFHRPHAPAQPLEQRHVVGVPAEERLAEVNVRLDEAGEEIRASRVDHRVVPLCGFGADRRDPAVAHRHRSPHDVERIVHRQDRGVSDQG